MRYLPASDAAFNKGKQSVLLFPGIAMNISQFVVQTPDERKGHYKDMTLPSPLADWAQGDEYIAEDTIKYYSLAHYLWLQ